MQNWKSVQNHVKINDMPFDMNEIIPGPSLQESVEYLEKDRE